MRAITNIFLTDDDTDDCQLFSEIIQEISPVKDAKLTISNDGVALMKTLDETVPPPPEVIFLDLNMPRKNGFECLEEIRKTPKLMNIPVVIFSTSSSNDVVDRSYKFGANYYICKPQSYTQLKKTIAHVLSLGGEKLSGRPDRDHFVITVA